MLTVVVESRCRCREVERSARWSNLLKSGENFAAVMVFEVSIETFSGGSYECEQLSGTVA
jgi:hypothetical protein